MVPWKGALAAEPERVGAPAGAVLRLRLSSFRSYEALTLAPDARPVVLVGENGAGKTNILEAISMLGPGRGLRGAKLSALARRSGAVLDEGSDGAGRTALPWAVAARIVGPAGPVELGTGQTVEGAERRSARVAGRTVALAALSEQLRLLWLTPAMDRLFGEGAGGRRRFFDRLTLSLDPGHAARAAAYERALRERNRLLRDGVSDAAWLAALESELVVHGVAIAEARVATLHALSAVLAGDGARDGEASAFPRARLALDGMLEATLIDGADAEEVARSFAAALARGRARDEAAGRTLLGPHMSDLLVFHQGNGRAAAECSTGEQKALLVGLILVQARLIADRAPGRGPVLLLDEIAAHLDAKRRADLFDALLGLGIQAWLTGTDAGVFAPLGGAAQQFVVASGTALPAGG